MLLTQGEIQAMYRSKLNFAAAVLLAIGVTIVHPAHGQAGEKAAVLRVPDHGIQPQVAVDAKGVVHLLYYKGEAGGGDIFYARSEDGVHFKHPLRVNSQSGS